MRIEDFEKMKIGLDDKFRFSCKQCGKCCTERADIILSPLDLFRAAKKLNLSPMEFVQTYCDKYIGDTSKMVIIRLKPRGSNSRCPMLKERKCSIHDAKPAVCAMFPIGRSFQIDLRKTVEEQMSVDRIQFIFNGTHCGNAEEHTVREWLESFGIPIRDEFFVEWHKLVSEVGNVMKNCQTIPISEKDIEIMYIAIYYLMYLKYDTNQEFMSQFLKNCAEVREVLYKKIGVNDRRDNHAE